MFSAASYYDVELLRDFGEFKSGAKFARIDVCIETGCMEFIYSNETTVAKILF